jgi:transmembrane 9 superfamily protein 3
VLTAALLPVVVSVVVFLINFIAIYYQATRAIPFTTMVRLSTLYEQEVLY